MNKAGSTRHRTLAAVVLAVVGALVAFGVGAGAATVGGVGPQQRAISTARACGPAGAGEAACLAVRVHANGPMAKGSGGGGGGGGGGKPTTTTTSTTQQVGCARAASVYGYGPDDLQRAYNLTASSCAVGSHRVVAIVDAFDDPSTESDLAVYRSTFGLPPMDCVDPHPCFHKINEVGLPAPLPAPDLGWSEEISLDVDMVSAVCPLCDIVLVEAATNYTVDLDQAEDAAAAYPGVVAISNSWGSTGSEPNPSNFDAHFNHPGIAITAASGDSGLGVSFPASSQYVSAVGGTTLQRASTSRGWTESVWSGSGGGCSAYEPKPAWQTDTLCPAARSVADVAAVADPDTPVAVYNSFADGGWAAFGGTSVSSPIIASVYALAGNTASITYASYPWTHQAGLYDVTIGGLKGYDFQTGLGTPNGTSAF